MGAKSEDGEGSEKDERVVSDVIVQRLRAEVDVVFGVYGGAIAELWDAFPRNRLEYVCAMHEQAAGFMAEGYAKIHGFGIAMATSGPGGLNLVTCIGNCYYDSTPVLFITGQVNSKFMKPEGMRQLGFQETDIVSIVKPITKYAVTIKSPLTAVWELNRAIDLAKEGRPGPTLIDICADVQRASI